MKRMKKVVPQYTLDDVIETEEDSANVEYEMAAITKLLIRLNAYIGRELTDKEQDEVLGIVQECSAKDDKGNIIEYAPFDYAWHIYNLRQRAREEREE